MIESVSRIIIDSGLLYFLLVIIATFIVAYCVALVLNAISLRIDDRKRWAMWMMDIITGPVVMFVLTVGYGMSSTLLTLSLSLKISMEDSVAVINVINAAWLLYNAVMLISNNIFRTSNPRISGMVKLTTVSLCVITVIAVFSQRPFSLVLGAGLALCFIMVSQRLTTARTPKVLKTTTVPKKIVITHVYISNRETHEAVLTAINLIKTAISENDRTDRTVSVTLSAFKPYAFDILVHYVIKEGEQTEDVKQQVNLAIIKKLNDNNILLSGASDST